MILGPNGQPANNASSKITRLHPWTEFRVLEMSDPEPGSTRKMLNITQARFAPNGTLEAVTTPLLNAPSEDLLRERLLEQERELLEIRAAIDLKPRLRINLSTNQIEEFTPVQAAPASPDLDEILADANMQRESPTLEETINWLEGLQYGEPQLTPHGVVHLTHALEQLHRLQGLEK